MLVVSRSHHGDMIPHVIRRALITCDAQGNPRDEHLILQYNFATESLDGQLRNVVALCGILKP
jgi:hypothetical protein